MKKYIIFISVIRSITCDCIYMFFSNTVCLIFLKKALCYNYRLLMLMCFICNNFLMQIRSFTFSETKTAHFTERSTSDESFSEQIFSVVTIIKCENINFRCNIFTNTWFAVKINQTVFVRLFNLIFIRGCLITVRISEISRDLNFLILDMSPFQLLFCQLRYTIIVSLRYLNVGYRKS